MRLKDEIFFPHELFMYLILVNLNIFIIQPPLKFIYKNK